MLFCPAFTMPLTPFSSKQMRRLRAPQRRESLPNITASTSSTADFASLRNAKAKSPDKSPVAVSPLVVISPSEADEITSAKPCKPGRSPEFNDKAKELCRSHASLFNVRERRHSIAAGELSSARHRAKPTSGQHLVNSNYTRAMESLSAAKHSKQASRQEDDDVSTCIYAEPWKPGRGKPLCDSVLVSELEKARRKSAVSPAAGTGQGLKSPSKGTNTPLGSRLQPANEQLRSMLAERRRQRSSPAIVPAPPTGGPPALPSVNASASPLRARHGFAIPPGQEHNDYVEPADSCFPLSRPHTSEQVSYVPAQTATGIPQPTKPKSGLPHALKRKSKSAFLAGFPHSSSASSGPTTLKHSPTDGPDQVQSYKQLSALDEMEEKTTAMRPRSSASSQSSLTSAAQRARERSAMRSLTSSSGVSLPALEAEEDDIFFGQSFHSPTSESCCPCRISMDISLDSTGCASIVDGVPNTPGLRRHIGMAGKVEDLLELMTSSGWSLTKFTKSTDAESPSKSSKKAPSDVRVSCLFTRCGCLGKQLHRKAEVKKSSVSNGQEPAHGETTSDEFLTRESTPTSLERVTSNGQNGRDCQTQLTNDQSISISSLESDPSPASTPSEKQAEQYLEKYLPEKEASELKLLLRFFNINLPFVPKETDI